MKRRRRRPSPTEQVSAYLRDLGYSVESEDFRYPKGAWRHIRMDIVERWGVHTNDANGKRVEICSRFNLTECRKGIKLLPAPHDSDLYGDFEAFPIDYNPKPLKSVNP